MSDTNSDIDMQVLPSTTKGIESFLAGSFVEGIGPVYARKLVEKYGKEIIPVLKDNPSVITGISGLGANRVSTASKSLNELKLPLEILLFLYSCEIPELFIGRILDKYKRKVKDIILRDPFDMVEDVWKLSFFIADKIGKLLNIKDDDPRRLRGALVTAVKHHADNGHLFAKPEEALEYASQITGIETAKINEVIDSLINDHRLIKSRGGLYLPVFYEAEKNGANKLLQLASTPVEEVESEIIPNFDINGNRYTPVQLAAIRTALENPVMVLTGGPGSGKTTVLKGIIDIISKSGKSIILTAPTGRAAKRMSVLTGCEAQTIHRLLGYREGEGYHKKNIETDLLIIDEGSMMEQVLFNHLLQAIKPGNKVLIVGDVDQLPAIGAGDVMRELITSGKIPVVTLDENFRQKEGSAIAAGARAINSGNMPETNLKEDFIIINEHGIPAIHDKILELIEKELPQQYGMKPSDIQIVTPQQMGPLGARQLNMEIQKLLNPSGPEIKRGNSVFRLGDPVMQTANSRDRNLYNGETGRIIEIDPEGKFIIVGFQDGKESKYDRSELSELVLAYATTVHKLQGSEVDYMIMPVTMSHRPMLYRNLLYTGVSRARKLCVLVGEDEAIRFAIDNKREATRNSNFSNRLRNNNPPEESNNIINV